MADLIKTLVDKITLILAYFAGKAQGDNGATLEKVKRSINVKRKVEKNEKHRKRVRDRFN